jgi:hypothetical protein
MVTKSSSIAGSKSLVPARKPEAGGRGSRRAPSSSAVPAAGKGSGTATRNEARRAGENLRAATRKARSRLGAAGTKGAVNLATAGSVASRVVHQAASILEEEIARGIVAAQEVERRFIDVGAVREEDPDHVMQRFRRDAHDLVDILIDLVHVSVRTVGRAITLEAGARPALPEPKNGKRELVSVDMPGPITPGATAEVTLTLTNSDPEDTPPFTFNTLGLVSAGGKEIPAEFVRFSPKQLVIEAESDAQLKVSVTAPEGTPAGRYTGLLQSTHLDRLCATLSLDVAEPQ